MADAPVSLPSSSDPDAVGTPIHRIPNEMLQKIFLDASRLPLDPVKPWHWYDIVLVCSHWKSIALAYHELWCAIDATWPIEYIPQAVQRAGGRQLELYSGNSIALDSGRVSALNLALKSAGSLQLQLDPDTDYYPSTENVNTELRPLSGLILGQGVKEVTVICTGNSARPLDLFPMAMNGPTVKKLVLDRCWFTDWKSFLGIESLTLQWCFSLLLGEDSHRLLAATLSRMHSLLYLKLFHLPSGGFVTVGPDGVQAPLAPTKTLKYLALSGGVQFVAGMLSWFSQNSIEPGAFINLDIECDEVRTKDMIKLLFPQIRTFLALSDFSSFSIDSEQHPWYMDTIHTRRHLCLTAQHKNAKCKLDLALGEDAFIEAINQIYSSEGLLPKSTGELIVMTRFPEAESDNNKPTPADRVAITEGLIKWIVAL
ncbi:hypothetical protein FA95DRAFT_1611686 [Auriscalpium vulgare]|uniref:Uncharacterized protein n=1 Tax=Auriscalpium vulgare TaxID=40419 RepID=A0ACB8R917_9AGAM|nr:hypothetical protein FA95DRAFT_1611686 [Auriscalpium vulgare]